MGARVPMPSDAARPPDHCVLWRRLDMPGHEFARLVFADARWTLSGTAVLVHGQQPCRLDYLVVCDAQWQTLSGRVAGSIGSAAHEIELSVDTARRWRLNGRDCPDVTGCIDVDLGFSPSTNLLPIRRLGLAVGHEASLRAAWLTFPGLTLQPLEQLYRRTGAATYRYESAGGRFARELQVNEAGLVTLYPDFWQLEAGA
jgi:hypothetical protein